MINVVFKHYKNDSEIQDNNFLHIYFIADKSKSENDSVPDIDIWYAERKGNGWDAPVHM